MLRDFLKKTFGKKSSSSFKDHLYILVLAGGGGTRLWPKSREATPKQFLPLFNKQTLTQITFERLSKVFSWDKIFVITVSEKYKSEILKEVPGLISKNIIVEPARRDTAPAHGLGALYIHNIDPEAVIVTEATDRLAKPIDKYFDTLEVAAEIVFKERCLATVGVKPRFANPGLGYIKRGELLRTERGVKVFKLDSFKEKPSSEVAEKYIASGNYFWNAGQYIWRADSVLDSLKTHAPEIYKKLEQIKPALGTNEESSVVKKIYESMPKIAIDYAISEKEKNFVVVEGDFYWTDIGDWSEVWENLPKDKDNNVIIDGEVPGGRVINIDTNDSLIHMDGRLIAIVDVDDIAIVDTKDILLVCKKSRAQSVKKIVEKLKEEKRHDLL